MQDIFKENNIIRNIILPILILLSLFDRTMLLLPVVALLLALVTSSGAQLQWEQLHDGNHTAGAVPHARRDAAIGYDADLHVIVLFGGRATKNEAVVVLGDTWIFDLVTSKCNN